jgi:lycopene beta-cyclase
MKRHDFIIAGAGAAGLSLAHYMLHSPLRDHSILIVDKDDDDQLNRNWGFWVDGPTLFDSAVKHEWRKLQFVSDDYERTIDLGHYRYKMARGADFYRATLAELEADSDVSFARGVIQDIRDGPDEAEVIVDGQPRAGRWVFDSLLKPSDLRRRARRHRFLKMHFKGWEIETGQPAFDPAVATMFDFRTPQRGAMRFFYVMPFSERRALVEYTLFSADVLPQAEYEQALRDYIEDVRGISGYRVLSEENGAVPVTDYPFARRAGARVMTIGAKGGQIKPSTGYSIIRVQRDSAAIVNSLLANGHPFDVPRQSAWYRLGDSALLEIILSRGELIKPIFTAMFRHNPIERIFHFLDERATPGEQARLFATLPMAPFIRAVAQVILRG